MNEEKNLKKGNGEQMQQDKAEEGVEGYEYCNTHKAKCSNDCGGGGTATPYLSDLH